MSQQNRNSMSDPTTTSRKAFEQWISAPPIEKEVLRYPADETKYAWPGSYRDYKVQLAWEAWQEALSSMTPEVKQALEIGLDYARENLCGHDVNLGRDYPRLKARAEFIEEEIRKIQLAIAMLSNE